MKILRKRKIANEVLSALLLCGGIVLFLISQIRLEKESDRNIAMYSLSADLKEQIQIKEMCATINTPKDIIVRSSDIVCKQLSFSVKNDIPKGKANCVGYAQLTSTILNYAFQIKNLPYKAKPVVGKVYLLGIDLNNIAQKILPPKQRPFFKNHDFVEVDLGNKTVFIDTSLQDLIGYRFYQIKKQINKERAEALPQEFYLTLLMANCANHANSELCISVN